MDNNERAMHRGEWRIRVRDTQTGEIQREDILHNHISNASLSAMASILTGVAPDLQIARLALGTSNTAVSNTHTGLITEQFRTAPVSGPTYSGVGEVTTEFYVTAAEGNISIEEVGIFGGTAATAAADTGTLISRILWSHVKTSTQEISFIRKDTVGRG